MLDIDQLYQQKLTTAENAASLVPAKGIISIGMRLATPPTLLDALAKRAQAGDIKDLKVYYVRCGDHALTTIFREEFMDVIHPYSTMLSIGEVKLQQAGYEKNKKYINFVPITLSRYAETIRNTVELDTFLVTVAPMDKFGYFNFGTNGDYAIDLSRYAKKLIIEVNENMPRTSGGSLLHISEVDAIVENNCPLIEGNIRPGDEIDKKIGQQIAQLIPDGATIQLGIGSVTNIVCEELKGHKHLGVHSEVLMPGIVDLIKAGVVDNTKKNLHRYRTVYAFAVGNKAMYEYMDGNPSISCYPFSHVNDPLNIGKIDNIVSVNTFVEIDFSGQVNAEFIKHQYSAAGGQLDFIRGAYYSKNGKAILACRSTTNNGKISKIVPRLSSITTDTRLDVDYIVTEYGYTQLQGKSTTERTKALIELAHPNFREELTQKAKEQHFI